MSKRKKEEKKKRKNSFFLFKKKRMSGLAALERGRPDLTGGEIMPKYQLAWEVMDELMQTLRLVFPQMYSSTMQKIKLKTQ